MEDFPKSIIYVDDDSVMRGVVVASIAHTSEDCQVVTFGEGQAFVEAYKDLDPDLILLDLRMPGMDGPSTIEALRVEEQASAKVDVPIIFITGVNALEMQEDYSRLGVIGVIHKPFNPSEFGEQVKELWNNRHPEREDEAAEEEAPAEDENSAEE